MARSTARKKKQPRARPAPRTEQTTLPPSPEASADDAEDFDEDVVAGADDLDGADKLAAPAPSLPRLRGTVSTVTSRRGRVPNLLRAVIEARVEVARAERLLENRVRSAREHGATWEDLGLALDMSRQGAAKRYG